MQSKCGVWNRLVVFCCLLFAGQMAGAAEIEFEKDVAPILESHCLSCHNDSDSKGDISLATSSHLLGEEIIVPGNPDESYLIELISVSETGKPPEMPKKGEPLSDAEIGTLREWIRAGGEWPKEFVLKERSKADASWWSLQPLKILEPPGTDGAPAGWRESPIDRFVYRTLAENELKPAAPASRRDLIRRITFDLTGLPPTPEEVSGFASNDSPDAYEHLVDRLLASPRYGERWGRHWLDVIRFGESRGFERNEIIRNIWPFRDYIIRSFNEDKPFDQLIMEHIAGDVIGRDNPDVELGTAFLVCGPYDDVGNQDPAQAAQIRANTVDEIIRGTSEAFLGLTMGCARCHDHKFDPILQTDYYSWYSIFSGVRHGGRTIATTEKRRQHDEAIAPLRRELDEKKKAKSTLENEIDTRARTRLGEYEKPWTREKIRRTGVEEAFPATRSSFVKLLVDAAENNPNSRSGYRIDEFEVWTTGDSPRNVALATNGGIARGDNRVASDFEKAYSSDLTNDGKFGARWIASSPELTIELAEPEMIDRVLFSSDRVDETGTHSIANFIGEYRVQVSIDGETWIEVANSKDRKPINEANLKKRLHDLEITAAEETRLGELGKNISNLNQEMAKIEVLPNWWAGKFEPIKSETHVFLGGDPQRKGEIVVPASLNALAAVTERFKLSHETEESLRRKKLAEWIVSPTNPLAPRVLANRLWHYHFGTGIVATPSDFGYMGSLPSHPELLDWLAGKLMENNWKLKPVHKLILMSQTYRQSAEFRSDAAQKDAGSRLLWRFPPRRLSSEELRDTLLSLSGELDLTMGGPGFKLYRYLQDNVATYVPLDQHGPETYRRSVYHHNARAAFVDLFVEFDCPDNAFAVPRRSTTTTPLQALTLMNHSFTLDMANAFAERVKADSGELKTASQIRQAFLLAYSRDPEIDELEASLKMVHQHGLSAFCRALLNSNELIYLN